ncbi:MAG: sigma-70 family RNA polymerase sigma factor [Fuerstiella sp.]
MADGIDVTSMTLLGRAQAQDQEAWHQVVHLYGPLVEKWCRRSGLSEEDTADIFQDTFRTVSQHIGDFVPGRSVASFRSWLKTIVRTRTIDHFRKARRQMKATGGTAAQAVMAEVPDPIAEDSDDEEAEAEHALVVHRAMELIKGEFDPRNWAAFELVALKGRSATEVAHEVGVAPQTIRQANYRIRRRLRLILQDLVE